MSIPHHHHPSLTHLDRTRPHRVASCIRRHPDEQEPSIGPPRRQMLHMRILTRWILRDHSLVSRQRPSRKIQRTTSGGMTAPLPLRVGQVYQEAWEKRAQRIPRGEKHCRASISSGIVRLSTFQGPVLRRSLPTSKHVCGDSRSSLCLPRSAA